MNLWMHIGLYKAGSSFLQHQCAIHAAFLASKGVYFPPSANDQRMAGGWISSGNASSLAVQLMKRDHQGTKRILASWKEGARLIDAGHVLVSAESLVHPLAREKGPNELYDLALSAGFTRVNVLVFLRDPADHAVSTYKHRSQSGRYPDFEDWLASAYETPAVLSGLLSEKNKSPVHWTFRKFSKDRDHLRQSFFAEWLSLDLPSDGGQKRVNESLTLDEVRLINHLAPHYPWAMDHLADRFRAMPKSLKDRDKISEHLYRQVAASYLARYQKMLDGLNALLPVDEQLALDHPQDLDQPAAPSYRFSHQQIETLVAGITWLHSYKGQWLRLRRRIARSLPQPVVKYLLQWKN